MTPTKLLIGQIAIVLAIMMLGVWAATQWAAAMLGYQSALGAPSFVQVGKPVYESWAHFGWWYHYEAYTPGFSTRPARLQPRAASLAAHRRSAARSGERGDAGA